MEVTQIEVSNREASKNLQGLPEQFKDNLEKILVPEIQHDNISRI